MKKLAIIGGSSAIVSNGYAKAIKKALGDQCDIYGLGTTSILWQIYTLLRNEIIDKFEFVLIQYDPVDSFLLGRGGESYAIPITYLGYIFSLFANSKSIPLVLGMGYTLPLLGTNGNALGDHNHYIIEALCRIYNVKLINLRHKFRFVRREKLLCDHAHYNQPYSDIIARLVLKELDSKDKILVNSHHSDHRFEIYEPANIGLDREKKGTRLLELDTYVLRASDTILIPADKYLCGILYWIEEEPPLVLYENSYVKLCKPANAYYRHIFNLLQIGCNCYSGLRGGQIKITDITENCVYENNPLSSGVYSSPPSPLYIHSLILSNRPPVQEGDKFYREHIEVFAQARNETNAWLMDHERNHLTPLWPRLKELVPDLYEHLAKLLDYRPDLANLLDNQEYRAERLLLWAWAFGRDEEPSLFERRMDLLMGLYRLWREQHYAPGSGNFPVLLRVIQSWRPDLAGHDITTKAGLAALTAWFADNGLREYRLEEYADMFSLTSNK